MLLPLACAQRLTDRLGWDTHTVPSPDPSPTSCSRPSGCYPSNSSTLPWSFAVRNGDGGEELSYVWKSIGLTVMLPPVRCKQPFPSSGGTAGKFGLKQPNPRVPFSFQRNNPQTPINNKIRLYKTIRLTQLHSWYWFTCSSSPNPWIFCIFLSSFMIRGCFFSPYCQHCWVETMAHITETHRNVLDGLRSTYDGDWPPGAMSDVVIGQQAMSITAREMRLWIRRLGGGEGTRKERSGQKAKCRLCVCAESPPHSVLEWG